jgi:NDP-sugar pyrophosphorylase family protein
MVQIPMLPVAILAGGLATRLHPITQTIPKALVDVAGQPFILRQLAYLHMQGIREVVLCVGYLGEMIEAVVGDGDRIGLKVRYSHDGPILLGTGGALKKAVPLLGDDFFVLYGDSFLPIDFVAVQQAYLASGQRALMTVLQNANQWDTSNVLFTDGRLVEYNKRSPRAAMSHIDYGLGLLAAEVLSNYPATEAFDLADVYQDLSGQGRLCGMEVYQRFYEIGSHTGLQETETYFLTTESA